MKKLFGAALALALSLGLAGCSQGAQDSANTLTIMGNEGNLGNTYIERIIDLYEEKTGNEVEIVSAEQSEFNNAVKETIAKEDAPDVFMLFNNSLMADLGGTEQFRDLADQPWVSDLTDSALAYSSNEKGEILGLPFWENSVSGCYYNKTILDSMGLRAATNQAEFDRLCAALVSAGYTPLNFGDESCYAVFQFGLDPIIADNPEILEKLNSGEMVYSDIPEVVNMVTWMKDAYDAGWFGTTTEVGPDRRGEVMGTGEAVSLFTWDTWFDTKFVDDAYTKEDFALMPMFLGTADEGTYEGGNMNMFTINKDSDKQDLALEFLEFCATPENYNEAFDGIATVAVFKGQTTNVESPMVQEMAESIAEKERPSSAEPKIKGYNALATKTAIHQLFRDEITLEECLQLIDDTLKTD